MYFLQELHLHNTWLTRLPPSIRNLTKLKILDVEASRISFLPDGVFEGMKDLLDVKIADGKITQVSGKIFSGLRKVKRLSLYKNNITALERVSSLTDENSTRSTPVLHLYVYRFNQQKRPGYSDRVNIMNPKYFISLK